MAWWLILLTPIRSKPASPLTPPDHDRKKLRTPPGLFNTWIAAAREVLTDEHPANMFTLRGFSSDPQLPKYDDVYALQAVCVAVYPMYKGVAKLVGMDVHNFAGDSPSAELRP